MTPLEQSGPSDQFGLPTIDAEASEASHDRAHEVIVTAATVGVVAVGAALIEISLIPGIAIGVIAVLAPGFLPKFGEALMPMFRSSVRGAYRLGQKSHEMIAEAREQIQDLAAEVEAESEGAKDAHRASGPIVTH